MLAAERARLLVEILDREGSLSVTRTARRLGVSPSTVRRDIIGLQRRGLLDRVYGGAVAGARGEPEALDDLGERGTEKRRIARAAAQGVLEGETVFIGGGSTAGAVIAHLAGRRGLTVVTNNLRTALSAGRRPDLTVVVLGGYLRPRQASLVGHITAQAIAGLNIDRVLLGAYALDADGLMGADLDQSETDRMLIAAGTRLTVLADASKFERRGPARLARPPQISTVVTDSGAPAPVLQALADQGVDVVVC